MAAKEKFIWRIENFSTFTAETELHSPTFSLNGHQWKIRFVPKGFMGFMSAYLELDDSTTTAGVSSLAADFRLSLVNQDNRKFSLETTFKEDSTLSGGGFKASAVWVPSMALASGGFLVDDTLVFEAQIRKSLRAMVYSNLLMLRTVLNEESGGKTEACPPIKEDATLQDMSNRIPRTKAQLLLVYGIGKKTVAKYGDRLLQTLESTISDYYAEEGSDSKGNVTSDSAKRKRECAAIEPSEAIDSAKRWKRESAAIEPSEAIDSAKRVSVCAIIEPSEAIDSAKRKKENAAIEPSEAIDSAKRVSVCAIIEPSEAIDSAQWKRESAAIEPSEAIDSAKRVSVCAIIEPSEAIDSAKKVARTSTIKSPCSSNVRSASKNLIAELSTIASSWKSTSVDDVKVSTSEANHGSALLQEQRGILAEFFEMSLEAICQSNWFDSVHEVVLKISDLATDPFEKRILKDLLSRLVEFRSSTPESLSIVESSPMVETSNLHAKKQIEGSLLQRQNQLTFLDSEVSRIEEDQLKVDAEIQQLLARKGKLVHEKKSALAEMEAANREASMELGDLERKQAEHEQARDDLLRAKEKLAQNNLSWKLFKENLGL